MKKSQIDTGNVCRLSVLDCLGHCDYRCRRCAWNETSEKVTEIKRARDEELKNNKKGEQWL